MKKLVATISLMTVLMVGNAFAGIIVNGELSGRDQQPCTTNQNGKGWINDFTGIIVNGFTGIIVNGFTGIIVNGATDNTPVNCGIILGD